MERHARGNHSTDNLAETKRLSSVDRLFLNSEYSKFVDKDLYEEEFYDTATELSAYFDRVKRKARRGTNEAMFQDPAFFSVYEHPKLVSKEGAPVSSEAEQEEGPLLPGEIEALSQEESYESPRKRRERERNEAAEKKREAALQKKEARREKKQRRKLTRFEKQKIGLTVSLILTILLIAGLVVGFFLAYKYSDSRTYVLKRDKTPPVVTTVDHTIFSYETLELTDFIGSIRDETEVNTEFVSPIDYEKDGEQTVSIRFTDEAGNSTVANASLTIIHDTSAPVIVCEPLIRVTVGQSLAYKSHVVVTDDYDEAPEITVDNSRVDLSKEGVYKIRYTATDKSGNTAVKKCKVAVTEATGYVKEKDVWDLVDATLSWVVDDSMDDLHKVWAVYEYVRHIPYVQTKYSFDYMYEGYKILHDNKGDCYGSFSAAKLMLDRLGIDNIPIETSSNGNHYWNMVSLDHGKTWYHFDATAWSEWAVVPVMCMISSGDLNKISELHHGTHRYNPKDYPATPKKSLPVPEDIKEIYGNDY